MIVISGALVLVALILLVIGLVSTALGFVYASIAISVVSFAFLIIGIVQRRGGQLPEGAAPALSTSSPVEGVTAIIPAGSRSKATSTESAGPVSGSVLVVAGRPRYHVAGCRYLTGKAADTVDVEAARGDGFTACGVCKPDESLTAPAATGSTVERSQPQIAPDPVAATRETVSKAPSRAAKAPARKAPAAQAETAQAPAKKVPAKKAPAKATRTAPTKANATTAATPPAKKAAATRAPAKKAPTKAAASAAGRTPAKKSAAKATATKSAAKATAKKSPAKRATR